MTLGQFQVVTREASGGEMKTLILKGPFSDPDIVDILQLLRQIERQSPQETFSALIVDDSETVTGNDALTTLKRVFPRLAEEEPEFKYYPRKRND